MLRLTAPPRGRRTRGLRIIFLDNLHWVGAEYERTGLVRLRKAGWAPCQDMGLADKRAEVE